MTSLPAAESLIREMVHEHGTPLYILDLVALRRNYARVAAAFQRCTADVEIFYSLKTNYLPIVASTLRSLGAGADVVSEYEMMAALVAGFSSNRIVFNGPYKTLNELEVAAAEGILVNIDGDFDAHALQAIACRTGRRIPVGLRVNPGVNVYTSSDPTYNAVATESAKASKFGWSILHGDADRMVDLVAGQSHLQLEAIHCHLGSQITDTSAYVGALDKVFEFVARLKGSGTGSRISRLNIGGGFGVPGIYRDRSGPLHHIRRLEGFIPSRESYTFQLDELVAWINEALVRFDLSGLAIACEPGRLVVSDAMCLVASVGTVKRSSAGNWIIVDAGLNLLPTAGPSEEHRIHMIGEHESAQDTFSIGGPLCYDADVFGRDQVFPADVKRDDLVLILDAGAYSVSRSTNFIRPRAPVVAVDGDRHELCWRRESFEDVFSFRVKTSFEDITPSEVDTRRRTKRA
jgi:diaminopimelate decarboxylase